MYVIRSGGGWDNPRIEFVTNNEEIAKAIVEEDQRLSYKKHLDMNEWMRKSAKEKIDFYNYKVEKGMPIDEWEQRAHEDYKLSLEHYSKDETFEEYTERFKSRNWFYEEVKVVDDLNEALAIFVGEEFP